MRLFCRFPIHLGRIHYGNRSCVGRPRFCANQCTAAGCAAAERCGGLRRDHRPDRARRLHQVGRAKCSGNGRCSRSRRNYRHRLTHPKAELRYHPTLNGPQLAGDRETRILERRGCAERASAVRCARKFTSGRRPGRRLWHRPVLCEFPRPRKPADACPGQRSPFPAPTPRASLALQHLAIRSFSPRSTRS